MNDRKSTLRTHSDTSHASSAHQSVAHRNELPNSVQQPVLSEKNSLLFTQILSGLVWNG